MASSGLGFQEENLSEHEIPSVVSRSLIQIDIENATTESEREKMVAKGKTRCDEGQASHHNNVGAASQRTISRRLTYLERSRPLGGPSSAHAENEQIAPTQIENVGGYLVKARFAPTLRLIFAKHGDIASNAKFKNFPEYTTTLLEIVSEVFKKLLEDDFSYVLSELNGMLIFAQVLEMADIDVSWLERHLAEVDDVRRLAIKAATRELDAKKKVMMLAKKKFKEIQRRLV